MKKMTEHDEQGFKFEKNSVLKYSGALAFYFFVLSFFIFIFEATIDLNRNQFWLKAVLALDFLLICSYFSLVAYLLIKLKRHFFKLIREEKADTIFVSVIIALIFMPRLAAAFIIFRLLFAYIMHLLDTPLGARLTAHMKLRPSQTLALSFIGLITLGSLLLMLPAATINGQGARPINALFTMTSASCVAGLSVMHLGAEFTRFGQGVILFGMQAGGLSIMVLSAAFAALVGGRIASRSHMNHRELLDISTPEELKSLVKSIAMMTFILELIGAIFLFILWQSDIPRLSDRLWWSVFHAVSAFCNAGLSLFPHSLEAFVDRPAIIFVIIALITAGGLGFYVLMDMSSPNVWEIKKPRAMWHRLQIQTKVIIIAYLVLDGCGLLLFLFFEYNGALHSLSIPNKIIAALFNAVSMRSGGFSLVPMGALAAPTIVFSVVYMFIGGAPGSTAGGIKVTTAAVSLMALRTMLRGRQDVEIYGRRLSPSLVNRSVSIVLMAAIFLAIFLTMLLATQNIRFDHMLFETVSAFGTVGLSLDTTASLNDHGKAIVIGVMYVGRIGPLTLAMAIGQRRISPKYQLPLGHIAVG